MAPGGGRTDWDSHSIADIIAKLQTMDSAQAAADAAALMSAVTSAQSVVRQLGSVFGASEWVLKGNAATAGLTSAKTLGADIATSAGGASTAITALANAGDTLMLARATELTLSALQTQVAAQPENAAAIRAAVTTMMNSHYSDPMSGTTVPAGVGGNGVGAGAGSPTASTTGSSNSGQPSTGVTPSGTTTGGTTTGGTTTTSTESTRTSPNTRSTTTNSTNKTGTTPTTTAGTQQKSTQNQANNQTSPTSTAGGRQQPNPSTPTPAGTVPTRVKDKPLNLGNLNRGGTPTSPRAPGGRTGGTGGTGGGTGGGTPSTPASPIRRVGVSTLGSSPNPGSVPSGQSANRGTSSPYAPHAGRTRGGDDGKHKAASYLSTTQHGEEVVGSLPLVGPPVIGDWARPQPESTEPK